MVKRDRDPSLSLSAGTDELASTQRQTPRLQRCGGAAGRCGGAEAADA
jgi:hypothetical protein